MRYSVVNLGCKVNRVESDGYEDLLSSRGFMRVSDDADIVVINTCIVTGEAEKKTRKATRQVLKRNPNAIVLVTGCAIALNARAYEVMDSRIEAVPKARSLMRLRQVLDSMGSSVEPSSFRSTRARERTRVGVKIQDGCDNVCTYCIVRQARGRATSRSSQEVINDVLALAVAGVREIVLSGINIGSYRDGDVTLSQLIDVLLRETAEVDADVLPLRFRLSSIEPMDVSDELIGLVSRSEGRICRHLHIPLQAGSSKVLREMARPYDGAAFCDLIDRIRSEIPVISLSTDIIVGFPGESDADFHETLDMARYAGFSKIHVFPYSLRRGTPAACREDQVQPEVKARRASELRVMADELRRADYARRQGTREICIVESKGLAMTESYFEIPIDEESRQGQLIEATLPPIHRVDLS